MESLDDLTPNQLRILAEEWAGLAYAIRYSFIHSEAFAEWVSDTEWADDYIVLRDCSEAVTNVEDRILDTGWMMRDIEDDR